MLSNSKTGRPWGRAICVALAASCLTAGVASAPADPNNIPLCVTSADLLRAQNYTADELFINTTSGNVLRITRVTYPMVPKGNLVDQDPVLFVPGFYLMSTIFLISGAKAEPQDFSGLDLDGISRDEFVQITSGNVAAGALPLFASNYGREVWLLDRRGQPGSRQLTGDMYSIPAKPNQRGCSSPGSMMMDQMDMGGRAPSFLEQMQFAMDARFWNFSLDEERNDFRQTVDFVLKRTATKTKRVSVVAHEAATSIVLAALSTMPGLMQKLASVVLWSPPFVAVNQTSTIMEVAVEANVAGQLTAPMPQPYQTGVQQMAGKIRCRSQTNGTRAAATKDFNMSCGTPAEPKPPRYFSAFFYSSSSHGIAQVGQIPSYDNKVMHMFSYGAEGNRRAYGQAQPPSYNLSSITNGTRISLYTGITDNRSPPSNVQVINKMISGSRYHLINDTTEFDHLGYFYHVNRSSLAITPSFYDLVNY